MKKLRATRSEAPARQGAQSSNKRRSIMKIRNVVQGIMFVIVAIVIVAAVATLLYVPETHAAVGWQAACCGDPICGGYDWCVGSGKVICCIPKE